MNCFLLKEVANKFIKDHSKEILSSDSGKMIRGRKTLMSDVLDVLVPTGEDYLSQPHINTLRIELDRQGKEFDGSRELLIARLQEGKEGSPINVAKDVFRKG